MSPEEERVRAAVAERDAGAVKEAQRQARLGEPYDEALASAREDAAVGGLKLTDLSALLAELDRVRGERDGWKRTAEHHFEHMRAALDLSYAIKWPADPEFLDLIADQIDCGGECETAWREWDTNATGCTKSDSAEGCPFEHACRLRDFAKAMRIHAWTLAFAPPDSNPEARATSLEAEVGKLREALKRIKDGECGPKPVGFVPTAETQLSFARQEARSALSEGEG